MSKTVLLIRCMYCERLIGKKDGEGVSGTSHTICQSCWESRFPDWEYPEKKQDGKED